MNKSVANVYVAILALVIIFAGVMGAMSGAVVTNNRKKTQVERWEIEPEEKDGDYYFHIKLPESDCNGNAVAFRTAHFECEVMIGDEVVYTLNNSNPKLNKSTGFRWNFVEIREQDEGKEMTVHIISVYDGQLPHNNFYYGNESEIVQAVCRDNSPRFLLAFLILIIGIVLFAYSVFIISNEHVDSSLTHFSVFSIMLASWSIMESPISDLIKSHAVTQMIIDHYALMLMPIPFMTFLCIVFAGRDDVLWKLGIYLDVVVVAVRTILQLFTLYDLKQTLWLTQASLVICILLATIAVIKEVRFSKMTKQMKLNLICIFCIFGATILELIVFIVFQRSSIFGMLGFVIYVGVMSVDMVDKSRKMVRRAQETELYRQLAYTDELTGVYNRTAFQNDVDNQLTPDKMDGKKITVFMFDLNDLKKYNDNFGHENGDKYIKMVANTLLRVFGLDARCYRIGGDEFCAIMQDSKQNEIDDKLITLIRAIQDLDRKGFVVPVSVAVGYAVYSPEYDETLEDTIKRADTLMYQNKALIKKNKNDEK